MQKVAKKRGGALEKRMGPRPIWPTRSARAWLSDSSEKYIYTKPLYLFDAVVEAVG